MTHNQNPFYLLVLLLLFPAFGWSQPITVGQTTGSNLFYLDVPDTTLSYFDGDRLDIDWDGGGVDFSFYWVTESPTMSFELAALTAELHNWPGFCWNPGSEPVGTPLDTALSWGCYGGTTTALETYSVNLVTGDITGGIVSTFQDGIDQYFLVRKSVNSNEYGWFRFQIDISGSDPLVTFKDLGLTSMTVGVEPEFPASGVGVCEVWDVLGRPVHVEEVSWRAGESPWVALGVELEAGLYVQRIVAGEQVLSRKVRVE